MNNFKAEEIKKVVMSLVGGSIQPIGDTAYDNECLERVKLLGEVAFLICEEIADVSSINKYGILLSKLKVSDECRKIIEQIRNLDV